MSIPFGFDMGPSDDDIVVTPEPGEVVFDPFEPLPWDDVFGYEEDDYDEGYA